MNTITTTHDTAAASSTQAGRTPAEDPEGPRAATEHPQRRLLDRITEAVRAAHTASVPF